MRQRNPSDRDRKLTSAENAERGARADRGPTSRRDTPRPYPSSCPERATATLFRPQKPLRERAQRLMCLGPLVATAPPAPTVRDLSRWRCPLLASEEAGSEVPRDLPACSTTRRPASGASKAG